MESPLTDRINDPVRLAALRRLPLTDAAVQEAFDRLSRLAAQLLGAPVSLVCMVEPGHHIFVGEFGLPAGFIAARVHPSDYSYCDRVVENDAPFVVADASTSDELRGKRALTDLGFRAYAGVPIRALDGSVLGALCVADREPRQWTSADVNLLEDLAASVVAEIEMRSGLVDRAEAHYRRLVTTVPYAVYVLDGAGNFTEVNPAAERILERSAESLLGESFTTVIAPSDLPSISGLFSRMLSGADDNVVFETSIIRPSGGTRLLAISATAMRASGGIVGVHGIAEDITERRRTEDALRESEERYRRMVHTAPYVIYALDLQGRFTELNRASGPILGRDPADLIGRPITDIVAADDVPKALESMRRKHERESDTTELEIHITTSAGERRLVHLRSTAIVRNGQVVGTHGVARDITEERRTEQALRVSEERFRQIAENVQEILWIFTPDFSQTLYMSPAYETIFGAPLDEVYRDPTAFMKYMHPDDMARIVETMQNITTTAVIDEEYRIIRPEGSIRWVKVRGYPVRNAAGEVIRIAGTSQDVTEQREAELALRDSEERLRQVLGAVPVGVVLTDAEGRIIWHNPASEQIWGGIRYVALDGYDQYVGWWQGTGERLAPDDWPVAHALRGEAVPGEAIDIQSFDGVRKATMNAAAPVRDSSGRITGAVWAQQDISHARALEAQRITLSTALEGLREGIALMTAEGVIQYANAAYIEMMGVDPATIPGLHLTAFAHNAAIAEEQKQNIRMAVETGRWQGRIWRRRLSDGVLVPFELILGRVDAQPGEVLLFGIAQEITEQIEQERQLRRAERLGSLGTLIAGVAHELNNPLQSILNFSQLLLLESESAHLHGDVETIAREARRMAQIVGDLKQVARSTQDEVLERCAVNLNELVLHVVHVQNYSLRTHNIIVTTDLAEDLPPVLGDRAQLEQVVLNLVVNAKQAMSSQDTERRLAIRTGRSAHGVALQVTDNGPGIAPEHIDRVFDPFFTTKPPGEGTGLGLSLAHSIVVEHGGEIRVDSSPDGGAAFRVDLPVASVVENFCDTPVDDQPVVQKLRVLIVDDEPAIRQVISRYLHRRGHRVDQAAEGRAALELIDAAEYDVIITDRRMPGMGGEALLELLRERALDQRVILLTGDPAGADGHDGNSDVTVLLKPIELQEVARAVESIGRGDRRDRRD